MSDRYPILVERFKGNQSLVIVCDSCHAEHVLDPDEMLNDAVYGCPAGCPGTAGYKFDEAVKCGGCGKLGYHEKVLGYCCSRVCQLQAEYAKSLGDAA